MSIGGCWRAQFGRYFHIRQRRTKLTTEIRAGTVTFLTMAYILAVNGAIVSDTGGTCTPWDCTVRAGGHGFVAQCRLRSLLVELVCKGKGSVK